jgi:SAM-dependent methyltransferase
MLQYKNEYDLDTPERTLSHREHILKKPFLKKLYIEWYSVFLDEMRSLPKGKCVEIGSGGGFLKEIESSVITSDILSLPHIDMTFSALQMPFADSELSALFLLDTFHHLPDVGQFLNEASRVLKTGGKIVMIEPANSWWSRMIYKNFHHEPFDTKAGWQIPEKGPMSGANGALPWIVFERDADLFRERFPELQIEQIRYHTPLRYLLSGGVSFKTIFPGFAFGLFTMIDRLLTKLSGQLSMFITVKIKRK